MKTTFLRQLRYDLYLGNNKRAATDFLTGAVRISLDASLMGHLTFEIKDPDINADWIRMGTRVRFYGGYLEHHNPLDKPQNGGGYRLLFSGTVFKVNVENDDAGNPVGKISCIDAFYSVGGYSQKRYRYPSLNNQRSWASGNIRASEIVRNICKELDIECEVSLGQNSDIMYTLTEPVVQHDNSDWAFLNVLAERVGAYCWTTIENEKLKLFFVEQGKAFHTKERIEFVSIARKGGEFFNKSYSNKESVANELQRLKDNQVLMYDVSVTEDPGMYGQHTYKVTDFNSETGESKEFLANYNEETESIVYYELDTPLIEAMNKTESGRQELNRILGMGALSIPWSEAKKYYKEVHVPAGKLDALGGKTFLGVTVNATCIGDLRVLPYQSYIIHGVVRARNMNRKSSKMYLKSMEHIFDNSGYTIQLEFMA